MSVSREFGIFYDQFRPTYGGQIKQVRILANFGIPYLEFDTTHNIL
jgi:hypothetical protein